MKTLMDEKDAIRRAMRRAARCTPKESAAVQERLLQSELWAVAWSLGLYVSAPDEIATGPLFEAAWAGEFHVAVPARTGESYVWVWATPASMWRKGPFGIDEPAEIRRTAPDELRVVLVPGVAFDLGGSRLGHGGGFYDRLLAACPQALRVGLCSERRLLNTLPVGPKDIPMDVLMTEERVHFLPSAAAKCARLFGEWPDAEAKRGDV